MRFSLASAVGLLSLPLASCLSVPFTRTPTQPLPPKGFRWAVDVHELEGRVVRIRPDAVKPADEDRLQVSTTVSGFRKLMEIWLRPGVVISFPMASAVLPLGLAKLAPAVTVDAVARLVVAYLGCLARLKLRVDTCTKGLRSVPATAVAHPLRLVDDLRDGLFPANTILTLGVRPRQEWRGTSGPRAAVRSPAVAAAAMAH